MFFLVLFRQQLHFPQEYDNIRNVIADFMIKSESEERYMYSIIVSFVLCAVSVAIMVVVYRTIKGMPADEMGGPRARAVGIVGIVSSLSAIGFFFQFVCAVRGETIIEFLNRRPNRYGAPLPVPLWAYYLFEIGIMAVLIIVLLKNIRK